MGWTSMVEYSAPFIAMVMVECTDVGVATLSKAASSKGLASSIAVVYYNALGTFILLPVILFLRFSLILMLLLRNYRCEAVGIFLTYICHRMMSFVGGSRPFLSVFRSC